jgi:exoribonuclease-2
MNVLFEEDGAFRTGSVMVDNTASLQVELPSGKRTKVKAANVLLRFDQIGPAELLDRAESAAGQIDVDFLWEVCPEAEFGFEQLAADYHGHKPLPAEAAAILLRLHSAPIYFHRKGKGRFRRAPADILKAALAGLEKKKQQAAVIERMTTELLAGTLPAEYHGHLPQLIYKPDRNRPETKALEAACEQAGLSAVRVLEKCGAISDTHEYHLGRFLFEYFPRGTDFPPYAFPDLPGAQRETSPSLPADGGEDGSSLSGRMPELPIAAVQAFSIDDAHTTEIDDAFSVTWHADGSLRVGIHIAAPGLGITPDSDLGRIARERLSTVYMPGRKITMLPEEIVEQFTLAAGHTVPALSLYLEVASDLRITSHESRIEQVPVVANLRHHDIEPVFNEDTLAGGLAEFPFSRELKRLWELATVLEAGRGAAGKAQQRKEYNFHVDWDAATRCGPGRIAIEERQRGSPLDKLVAELMIVANATWGKQLDVAGIPALYRAQSVGKVRMTTVAAPHEGLGVDCYAWSSSPLRRYVDLVNQWQLIAQLRGEAPYFPPKSAELLAAMRDFELTYAAYAEFQRGMERYWCLRWLLQESVTLVGAQVMRESLVRCEHLPLVLRLPSLPESIPGTRIRLEVESVDLLEAEPKVRFVELLATAGPDAALEGESPSE